MNPPPDLHPALALLGPIGWQELLLLALVGVLIFGKRLPEVGKSIGKGIVEFKKGLAGVEDDLDQAADPKRLEGDQTKAQSTASAESTEKTAST